jgi:hypothetical protein
LAGVVYRAENNFGTVAGDPDVEWYSYHSPRAEERTVNN